MISRLLGHEELDLMGQRIDWNKKERQNGIGPSMEEWDQYMRTCFIESRECFACERWNYFLPAVTCNDIDNHFGGEQTGLCLTP